MNIDEIIEYGKIYALKSNLKFKHCAFIVKGEGSNRKIVAKGYNTYIMDLLNHNHSIHAEVAVLNDFMDNHISLRLSKQKRISIAKNIIKKSNYDMFVIRIGKKNHSRTGNSKPCYKCQQYLKNWNFRKIYYTT